MPLYEYECGRCHQRIEAIAKIGMGPKRHSGGCGGKLEMRLGMPSVHFMENENGGSGWSENGYRDHPKDYINHKGNRYEFPHKIRKKIGKAID